MPMARALRRFALTLFPGKGGLQARDHRVLQPWFAAGGDALWPADTQAETLMASSDPLPEPRCVNAAVGEGIWPHRHCCVVGVRALAPGGRGPRVE